MFQTTNQFMGVHWNFGISYINVYDGVIEYVISLGSIDTYRDVSRNTERRLGDDQPNDFGKTAYLIFRVIYWMYCICT